MNIRSLLNPYLPSQKARPGTRKARYLDYLNSEHWRWLRQQAFERDGYKCVRCGSNRWLCGHHKRYRGNLWKCTVADIETLCGACHKKHHEDLKRQRRPADGRPNKRTRRLIHLLMYYSASA